MTEDAEKLAKNFKDTFSLGRDVQIHFVGVWSVFVPFKVRLNFVILRYYTIIRDTVASVGVVQGNPFPLTSSAKHICTFRHALALDERRVKFLPEYIDGGSSVSSSNDSPVDVKEVWFAGTHSDM